MAISGWSRLGGHPVEAILTSAAVLDGPRASRRSRKQLGQSNQVVGGHGEGELPIDLGQPPVTRLAQTGDRLGPAERFFDALADAQADRIARMARGAAVDRRAPATVVLCHMWGDVDLAHLGDEVLRVEALVAANGDALGVVRVRLDQVLRRQPLGMPRGAGRDRTDDQLIAVLHQCVAHEAELGLLAAPLLIEPGVGIGGRGMRLIAALLAVKILLSVAPRISRRAGAVLRPETL